MPNPEHVRWLLEGADAWNKRREETAFIPDLSRLNVREEFEKEGKLQNDGSVFLNNIKLNGANLFNIDLSRARLYDGLLSLDEENALARYADYFSLTQQALDQNGVHTSLVQAAVIRDVTQGIIPKRQRVNGAIPFNLMKSEQLVWVIQGVDYLETVVRRERRGSSQGPPHPGGPGPLLPAQHLPQPAHRVGGDGTRWHRDAGAHDQAHLLCRQPEAVPGPVRQDSRLRALQRWVRHHAGRPDRQAADLPDRRRLVRLQPGGEPGPGPGLSSQLHANPTPAAPGNLPAPQVGTSSATCIARPPALPCPSARGRQARRSRRRS